MPAPTFRDPVRQVNDAFLAGLEVVSNKIYPLPGGTFRRTGDIDARLSHLSPIAGAPLRDEVTLYEHLATVKHEERGRKPLYFIAFRQTMDALLLEQSDSEKFPEWLMKGGLKQTELRVYIYAVKHHPSQVKNMSTHEDWLEHITTPWIFDSLAYFMMKQGVIEQDMYRKM